MLALAINFACVCSDWCLLDPCLEEEMCAQGHLSVSLNESGAIMHIQQSGIVYLSEPCIAIVF